MATPRIIGEKANLPHDGESQGSQPGANSLTGAMTREDIRGFDLRIPRELQGEPFGLRMTTRCMGIIKWFLGEAWLKEHIVHAAPTDYCGFDFSSDNAREEKTWRMIELAEMLFNLQAIEGFEACIAQLKAGQVESTYAELETAKWLFIYKVQFRFNIPKGKRGENYDLEVIYPNVLAAADTKCKFEASDANVNSVKNSLFDNRDQLPKGSPGIFFVKIPAHWLNTPDIMHAIIKVTEDFFRQTGRVVSVKYYSPVRLIENSVVRALFRFRELNSPKHRHVAIRTNWDVWDKNTAHDGFKATPDHWLSVIYL